MDFYLRYILVLLLVTAPLMTVDPSLSHPEAAQCGLPECAAAAPVDSYLSHPEAAQCGLPECAAAAPFGSYLSHPVAAQCGLPECAAAAPFGSYLLDQVAAQCGLAECAAAAPSDTYLLDQVAAQCGLAECAAAAPSDTYFDPIKDAKHLSFTDPTNISSKHTNGPSIVLINTWGATIFTILSCSLLLAHAYFSAPHDDLHHAIWIAFTPGVHSLDQLLRQMFLTDGSRFLFTYLEALREMYSATAAVCFMRMIDIQLRNHYQVDRDHLNEILRNKLFTFHYPFNVREPTIYRTTRENLFLMRTLAYQNVPSTFVLYASRILLEYFGLFGEISSHIFQIIYFVSSTVGVLAVYAYAQGIDPEIPERQMARKVGFFKLLIFLLWFQGPGVELMLAAQTYLIMGSLLWYCCTQIMDLMP